MNRENRGSTSGEWHRTTLGWLPAWSLILAGGLLLTLAGCRSSETPLVPVAEAEVDTAAVAPKVAAFCGDCHATPAPDTFPRDAWPEEVQQGYNFYAESGRQDLEVPPRNEVVAYYRALAPAEWPVPEPPPLSPGPLRFEATRVPFDRPEFPAVSHILLHGKPGSPTALLWCDMRAGVVARAPLDTFPPRTEVLARVPHPAHLTPTDLDGDGNTDFLVADLGTYLPEDHRDGQVLWLRPRSPDGDSTSPHAGTDHAEAAGSSRPSPDFTTHVLRKDIGRVADVQVADFNGDGQLDLIVAEFGWRQTGKLRMLWGEGLEEGVPHFREEVLDPRHGIIHVPVADLNGDQLPDFVALVSQEHECIDAFLNQGDGTFERRQLFRADDPSYGSSGIQLVDMDGDGDLDVLYTNGDTMDSFYLKPYHAVHWLENEGNLQFRDHLLTTMPGVYRAVAGDLDQDGDQDIAACAYIPKSRVRGGEAQAYDAVIWLEQQADRTFTRHVLERSDHGHMALELGDLNQDGRLDVIVGSYGNQPEREPSWLTLWIQQSAAKNPGPDQQE